MFFIVIPLHRTTSNVPYFFLKNKLIITNLSLFQRSLCQKRTIRFVVFFQVIIYYYSVKNSSIHFKVANNPEQKQAIYAFRYKIYIQEMGKTITDVDHENKLLKDDRDDHSVQFYLEDEDGVVACLRSFVSEEKPFTSEEIDDFALNLFSSFEKGSISLTGKLMIDPKKKEYFRPRPLSYQCL